MDIQGEDSAPPHPPPYAGYENHQYNDILSNEQISDNVYSIMPATQPLLDNEDIVDKEIVAVQTAPDRRRFYVLGLFAMMGFTQSGVWNTWGSISASAECAFGWEDSTISLLSNWGCITYVISAVFFSWLCDVKGLKVSMLVAVGLTAGGCGLRCITSTPPVSTWLIHIGHILNGFAGPVLMGGPPVLSSLWFPVHERTTATAFATGFAVVGNAVSYIIAPLLVPDVAAGKNNTTTLGNASDDACFNPENRTELVDHLRYRIMLLMYIEFAWAGLLFLLTVVYLPARPTNAPSVSAAIQRMEFKPALKALVSNGRFWMLSIPYALSTGVNATWLSILDVLLKPKGVLQNTAGWLGFWSSIICFGSGMLSGIFADLFARRMKLMIVILYLITAISYLAFTLMYIGLFPFTEVVLYITNLSGAAGLGAAPPLLYELVCESTFPVAEGVTNILNTCLNNLAGGIFLTIPMFVSGTTWMNWFMLASIVICIPIFGVFPERYTRFEIDTVDEKKQVQSPQENASE